MVVAHGLSETRQPLPGLPQGLNVRRGKKIPPLSGMGVLMGVTMGVTMGVKRGISGAWKQFLLSAFVFKFSTSTNWGLTIAVPESIFILLTQNRVFYFSGVYGQPSKISFHRFLDGASELPLRGVFAPVHSFLSERHRPFTLFGSAVYSAGLGPGGCVSHTHRKMRIFPRTSLTD